LFSAAARAAHCLVDDPPQVIIDHDAVDLCSVFTPSPVDFHLSFPAEPVLAAARGSAVLRAAFTRQLLAANRTAQLVLLGAGLDTFVAAEFSGPVWLVDRPAVLAWRHQVCTQAGVADIGTPVPFALPDAGLLPALVDAGWDPTAPTAVIALGLSMYLTEEQNRALLASLVLPPGSLLLMDVLVPDLAADAAGRDYAAAICARAGNSEPWLSRFTIAGLAELLADCGWTLRESRPEAEQVPALFWQRQSHLRPMRLVELVAAVPRS
jgi:methyltransferase (TIGR00027 family)